MDVIFDTGDTVCFEFLDSPVTAHYKKVYKNLQHVTFEFQQWDLPYYNQERCFAGLENYAKLLGIDVQKNMMRNQDYLNSLHEIYEKSYDGSSNWLYYHEHIHLCESAIRNGESSGYYHIDWREKGGLLTGAYRQSWNNYLISTVKPGQIFFQWSELGKRPYTYWHNNEPNNINRLCELAKPMLALRPKIIIAVDCINTLQHVSSEEFDNWWNTYHNDWCAHWGIDQWSLQHMYGVIPYAQTHQIDLLSSLAKENRCPIKIKY